MIAYLLAVFLLGCLFGGAFGYYSAERDRERKERESLAWRKIAEKGRE